ncbi:oligosaccharide flippase family protein [Flavobacteriaceae bacterium]|nr:oligosaccharide flippase family protein [Flavobacteriaceae bacterium]
MGIVTKQSINNTITTYIGFVLGALNVLFLYTYFLSDQYHGLLAFIISTATIMLPFISIGTHNAIIKFYSSYKINTEKESFLSVMLVIPLFSIVILTSIGITSMDVIKIILPDNNYLNDINIWVIIITAFSFAYFEIFYSLVKIKLISVFGNFLKEIFHRVLILFLLLFIHYGFLDQQQFIFSVLAVYILRTLIMMIYAFKHNSFRFKFIIPDNFREIVKYLLIICLAGAVANIVLEIDKFMIAKYLDISKVAYYAVAVYICSLITVPRRSLFQIANPLSSKLLNDKNYIDLGILYQKSSLNLLIVCGLVFLLITFSLSDFYSFIPESYKEAYYIVLIISFTKLYNAFLGNIDGIIFNSKYYNFIVFTGVLLIFLTIYLNYKLIPLYGIEGAAISSLIAICLYNTIKVYYVYLKFKLQPITVNTFKVILLILFGFIVSLAFNLETYKITGFIGSLTTSLKPDFHPAINIILKSSIVSIIYIFIVVFFKFSTDINNYIDKFLGK